MKTWKEKIVGVLTGRNSRGVPLWYSHKKILALVSEAEGYDVSKKYRSLTCYLLGLVKSGHLERAKTPHHLTNKATYDGKEYLYRRTAKPFVRVYDRLISHKNEHSKAALHAAIAHEIWREYPKLPQWFRRMMI